MTYPVKYSEAEVREAIRSRAVDMKRNGVIDDQTVFIVLLNGGVWFASHFFDCLGCPQNEVYYVKCHSYKGTERQELVWDYIPPMDLKGKNVAVLDDICDSGQTATAVVRYIKGELKAGSVNVVTLLKRADTQLDADISIVSCIEDRSADFFVGCGLDDNGRSRLLPYIGVIKQNNN